MLGLAALILAAASVDASPSLTSAPWWERFTFIVNGDGEQQACRYESSLDGATAEACDDDASVPSLTRASSSTSGPYTKITIERRFTPGVQPNPVRLATGDTLLGGQVLALAIDGKGQVRSCKVIGASGEMKPPYGCDEVRSERFEASPAPAFAEERHGLMTVLVYGHEEYPA